MGGILAVLLIGFGLAAWVLWRIATGTWHKVTGVFRSGNRKAGHSKVVWVLVRVLGLMLGMALWAVSTLVRPFLVLVVVLLAWKACRRFKRFLAGAGNLQDALLFRELQTALALTWATFTETVYVDHRAEEHFPTTSNWHWVLDLDHEAFGLAADLSVAAGGSLAQIDSLSAQPGDPEERLAAALNTHLKASKTLFSKLCKPYIMEKLSFASVDVQTTLERMQSLSSNDQSAVRSGEGVLTLMSRDPLWKTVPLPMPLYDEAWTRVPIPIPIVLGVDRWGQEVAPDLTRVSLMAKAGWGKSVLLDTVLMNLLLLPADRVVVIVIDCKWGMHHHKWERGIDWLVVTPDDATECLKAVHDQMEARADWAKANGLEKITEATPAMPAIVVICDEAQELPRSRNKDQPLAHEYMVKLFQKGRSVGVMPFTTMQYGTAQDGMRHIVINADLVIAGKLKDQPAGKAAMGEIVDKNFGPHKIPDTKRNRGVFAIGNQETGTGNYMRAYLTTPEDKLAMVEWCVEHNPRHQWDWMPEHGTAEEAIEIQPHEQEAINRLCAVLSIQTSKVDINDIPSMLKKAKGRMPAGLLKQTTEQLQGLLAA